VSGDKAEATFANEAGGHRWQRVPPTERKGRIQTSTITVAVLPEPQAEEFKIDEKDLEWSTTISQGKGGQSVNTTYSCVILKHKPSGETVRCQNERSQLRNKQTALRVLRSRLLAQKENAEHASESKQRKDQIGSGQRGDKRRTIRVKDGQVNDHVTGQKWSLKKYLNGDW
jgi:peptide chain release factor 1